MTSTNYIIGTINIIVMYISLRLTATASEAHPLRSSDPRGSFYRASESLGPSLTARPITGNYTCFLCTYVNRIEVLAINRVLVFHSVKGKMKETFYGCHYTVIELEDSGWQLTLTDGWQELVRDSYYFYTNNTRTDIIGKYPTIMVPVANVCYEEFDLTYI
ncbi:hypothetical protein FOL47_006122 [Perkinsus chesapeaki]|uniref:Uncharacterized protein n=1 Tax=Perkinsus chesapeaki TaxID=330153 RepID=A0A7J6MYJ3_PERCH|nr:hypothetical protein FOL47_006122 [Perkinsus chesapeaki]